MRRLKLPTTLVVVVLGVAGCGDDDPPQECTLEGVCPEDGRVCLKEDTAEPCCPVCPATPGQCPAGCILEFPPI
ncbi:MAG: hypothetical protein H0V17_24575 [Deltaproteobacteria bacterium]|nr:hypothetical protein [Deltaproteobacteria bacterium]